MPSFCAVIDCGMRAERDSVRFFRIPAARQNAGEKLNLLSKERRELWIRALKRGPLSENQIKYFRICSRHFLSGAPAALENRDNPDWIPNQSMGYFNPKEATEAQVRRYERSLKRKRAKQEEIQQPEGSPKESAQDKPGTSNDNEPIEYNDNCSHMSTQTDLTVKYLSNCFEDFNCSNVRICDLEQKLKNCQINENSFKNNDVKTCYFTGLPKAEMLFIFFETVGVFISNHSNMSVSPFQQLILTFMKLRFNLPFKFLAYQFDIAPSTASRIFYQILDILYEVHKGFVFWPTREQLRRNVPLCFKKSFGNNVAVIIDCFEVFMETPSNLMHAAQCWSNYKHHQTIKFLIGITPQGTISFISEAYGGRSSDKFISENCGFLDLLLPNDIILADRGFLIKESVESLGARLEIPAFTKGKSQLHPIDIEQTRNIATVRIHVERVIGLLKKKFKLFQGPIPMSMVSSIVNDKSALDKIVVVCSALINLCPSQIPSS